MSTYPFSQARAQLSSLLARIEAGEEIVITRNGRPTAKLVALRSQKKKPRTPNVLAGMMVIPPDFDELPGDIARALGIVD